MRSFGPWLPAMASQSSGHASATPPAAPNPTEDPEKAIEAKRKNTSFKITNILPSRPPSHDPEESGDDDPDDSHTEDISENFEYKQNFVQVGEKTRQSVVSSVLFDRSPLWFDGKSLTTTQLT